MTNSERTKDLLNETCSDASLLEIADKVLNCDRISPEEALMLYERAELGFLGTLANYVRESLHGDKTYFNRNFHIEPTNKCVFDCKFCSYSRTFQHAEDAWELSAEQMLNKVKSYDGIPITEVHIVGGVHPKLNLEFFVELVRDIKKHRPELQIKAFTAVELEYMFRKAKVNYEEGLMKLQEAGVTSLPGGGAEIFHDEVRNVICKDKASTDEWLGIHAAAHRLGMTSNCTMLYGHIENYFHRIHHMSLLRDLQDQTHGFNCFIPLKFRNKDNEMSDVPEATIIEDLKCYAMARIFLDNIPHLKAYWPMIGRTTAQLLLNFGVDDMDGTIDDSTRIYSMAGAEEQHPTLTTEELVNLIKQVGRQPIERDTLYHELKDYSHSDFAGEKSPTNKEVILN